MVKNSHLGIRSHLKMVPILMFTRLMLKQLHYPNLQDSRSASSYRMMSLAGSGLKTEEEHLDINSSCSSVDLQYL